MDVSQRAAGEPGRNAVARARARREAAGLSITDLSSSNPTRHGLLQPQVLDAVARHLHDVGRYAPDPKGDPGAREALADRYGGSPDDYWLTASTSQSYSFLMTVLADPGQAFAVPAPGYPLVEPLARLSGLGSTHHRSYYAHGHGWVLDVDSLRDATRDPAVRAVVTVNPGNPTGAYAAGSADDLLAVCAARSIPLLSDDVFRPFALDGTPSAIVSDEVPVFTLGGLSKLLCAPQLKLAWIRLQAPGDAAAEVREALDAVADAFLPVSAPVAAALPAVLSLSDASVAVTRTRLRTNLDALHARFDGTAFRVRRCDGGWNAILDVPADARGPHLAADLLDRFGLSVHPAWFYDLPDDGALVVSLLPEPAAFASGIHLLHDAVTALSAS